MSGAVADGASMSGAETDGAAATAAEAAVGVGATYLGLTVPFGFDGCIGARHAPEAADSLNERPGLAAEDSVLLSEVEPRVAAAPDRCGSMAGLVTCEAPAGGLVAALPSAPALALQRGTK